MPVPDARPCPACGSRRLRPHLLQGALRIVRCKECGLIYLANPPDEGQLYEDYHAGKTVSADEYDAQSGVPALAELHAINDQRLDAIGPGREGERLLDIGCGRGFFLKSARDRGFEVQGMDVSRNAVEEAHRMFGVDARVGTLEAWPASEEPYDVITLWHVLEHFLDPVEGLRRARAMLAEDGVIFIEVPNHNSLKFRLTGRKWQGGNHPLYHRTFFTSRSLKMVLRRAGFSEINRLPVSYRLPGRSRMYESAKRVLNAFALDAFLLFVARRADP